LGKTLTSGPAIIGLVVLCGDDDEAKDAAQFFGVFFGQRTQNSCVRTFPLRQRACEELFV